jgi:RND family efflux transporter MFP subunit
MRKIKLKTAYIIGALMIIFLSYFFIFKPKHNLAIPSQSAMPAAEVTVIKIKKENIRLSIELPARVSAYRISEVRPQVSGVIKKRNFVEGSFVKEGQQLYVIDPSIYQANFDSTAANLKTLRAKRDRYINLLEADAISKQEFDDVTAAFTQAESEFKKAKTNLNYSKVLAPISGYIGKSNVTEGALVNPGQVDVLTTITQLDPIYVDMAQPSKNLSKLEGQEDLVVSAIIDGKLYEEAGTLKFSEVFVDPGTDSVRLRSIFPNKAKKLLPGMFVNAKIHLPENEVITIPQRATNRNPDGSLGVFIVDNNNTIKAQIIKEGEASGDSWIVLEGLNEGDLVVYEGHQKIADGAKVNPVILENNSNESK